MYLVHVRTLSSALHPEKTGKKSSALDQPRRSSVVVKHESHAGKPIAAPRRPSPSHCAGRSRSGRKCVSPLDRIVPPRRTMMSIAPPTAACSFNRGLSDSAMPRKYLPSGCAIRLPNHGIIRAHSGIIQCWAAACTRWRPGGARPRTCARGCAPCRRRCRSRAARSDRPWRGRPRSPASRRRPCPLGAAA